ncbi:LOW QUALITY PROTEIN: uncharacterized protein [Leptinotarsa decemlineata]|uniref:LOW QUALITY PROTEIN: uncharacterized protein n=1 Tax=Leptinotarsa decemlineata TaxID=7539 RepID=UPI003D30D025
MMLSTNVLCMKKRKKKRAYNLAGGKGKEIGGGSAKSSRPDGGAVTMLQITEDTPPDMLAGAMDLAVHLPTGRAVKMSVERSTPMMDLLVQITTNHQLQLSNYTLQALGMAPSSEHSDKILPFKPNTPIGTLDTQNIKVIPKSRTLPVPKNVPPGHQPFESTFRLKVHLPRNQLYVTRVSRNVLLEDIMKKVCEEKNLDPMKYEFKHPGNLDEALDPKSTLSDYQIIEIYVVSKGTVSLNQAFSTSDIMALRKEEERKQMHNKTGGGVFNLIFRRGKSSMGSGSISSDTRSISPTHSDDSRSVTPPGVQQKILTPPKKDPPPDRPKPPQRKRRPAPKPPQQAENSRRNSEESRRNSEEKPPSTVSEVSELQSRRLDNGLVICHSRNSSDSSGYHEASVLSEHCNTSLPRRPKSAFVGGGDMERMSKLHSHSTTNLSKMSSHSKSTTSLGVAGRKKKTAPHHPTRIESFKPRNKFRNTYKPKAPPVPYSRINIPETIECIESIEESTPVKRLSAKVQISKIDNDSIVDDVIKEVISFETNESDSNNNTIGGAPADIGKLVLSVEEEKPRMSEENLAEQNEEKALKPHSPTCEEGEKEELPTVDLEPPPKEELFQNNAKDEDLSASQEINCPDDETPEIVAVIPKTPKESNKFDTFGKRRFQTLSSLMNSVNESKSKSGSVSSTSTSIASALENFNFIDDFSDLDENVFSGSVSSKKKFSLKEEVYNQLFGMHNYEDVKLGKNQSISSLRSLRSLYGFANESGMKKWKNTEDLDEASLSSLGRNSGRWVAGEFSESESLTSHQALDSLPSITSSTSNIIQDGNENENKPFGSTDSGIAPEIPEKDPDDLRPITPPPPPAFLDDPVLFPSDIIEEQVPPPIVPEVVNKVEDILVKKPVQQTYTASEAKYSGEAERLIETAPANEENDKDKEVADVDWQYQLPSPPKAFRDSSPVNFPDGAISESHSVTDFKDSVVTSPELFEKLKNIEDVQSDKSTITSDLTSVISEEDRTPLMNTLSLENLERRKSLVYNRELATSLKMSDIEEKRDSSETFSSSLTKFESTYMEIQNSSQRKPVAEPKFIQTITTTAQTHTLPNFKISTYDQPKQKIKVFEDDTVRSNTDEIDRRQKNNTNLNRSYVGHSMENISVRRNSIDEHSSYSNEDREYTFFKNGKTVGINHARFPVFRSEKENWSPSKPVLRSKSHLTLDAFKYRSERRDSGEEEISRSNSFYDVSGLQSLGVMRMIQNKLNTPTTSMENLNVQDRQRKPSVKLEIREEPPKKSLPNENNKEQQQIKQNSRNCPNSTGIQNPRGNHQELTETKEILKGTPQKPPETIEKPPEKTYKYRGPPTINMGTWSERPKVPVSVKEDADYTLGNVSSKLIVNTTNNNITSNNSIEIKSNNPTNDTNASDNSVSIKVNGTEPIKQGNVVIKIGDLNSQAPKVIDSRRFISHTTATGYRKPFSTSGKNQRPHSVAFDSDFDISRVPVVRSVELKKPFKDLGNTSVTQLNRDESVSGLRNKFSSMYRSSENLSSKTYLNQANNTEETKPASRVISFKPTPAPVVRGFKTNNETNWANRLSWNVPNSFNTLPSKPRDRESFATNTQVGFSQNNLRKTVDSNKIFERESNALNGRLENNLSADIIKAPPPPPQMQKVVLKKSVVKPVEPVMDQRDQLLSAIRNFGGKKGLKAAKA